MSRAYPMSARAQAGVGLIEVLIALLVLSIGMLGMAGLQMWSLKNNQGSMERGMAVMQTHTIADAMRADRTNATSTRFNIEPGAAIGTGRSALITEALTTWRASLTKNLGEGATGGIACNGATCDITIQWKDQQVQAAEDAEEEGAGTQTLTTQVRL